MGVGDIVSVAVVYFSQAGTTHQLAQAVGDGIRGQAGCSCKLLRVTEDQLCAGRFTANATLDYIDHADAVLFGSPTYMGGPAAQFKAFADATSDRWTSQSWSGKLASGFTVGSNPGGDQLATLQYFTILSAQHGMLWVNLTMPHDHEDNQAHNPGAQLGIATTVAGDKISTADEYLAKALGSQVAQYCLRLQSA